MSLSAGSESMQQVREFYDKVGWQQLGDCCYQNARYEDLRPVSREYIHRCHLRVSRHLKPTGRFMLDAGSGPIQYPEYLDYSRGYSNRVCVDISKLALQEARERIGDHGLFVLADITHLPFNENVFEGVVSLHTIHHLPKDEHKNSFLELYRVLAPSSSAVVVNGSRRSLIMIIFRPFVRLMERLLILYQRVSGRVRSIQIEVDSDDSPKATFVSRYDVNWLQREVGTRLPLDIFVWRSVSTLFLRTLIHSRLGGHWILKMIYWLEERFPHFFGKYGQYPLIVIHKLPA